MSFKRAKVVMLATNKKAGPISIGNKSKIAEFHMFQHEKGGIYNNHTFYHLYVLSDDKIEENDYFIRDGKIYNEFKTSITPDVTIWIRRYPNLDLSEQWREVYLSDCKKIIATTDNSLGLNSLQEAINNNSSYESKNQYGLPQPSQSFIEKFVEEYNKGNIITDVMVEYENGYIDNKPVSNGILKVNPKDNTITIKKVKDSFDLQEMKHNLRTVVGLFKQNNLFDLENWIEKNL